MTVNEIATRYSEWRGTASELAEVIAALLIQLQIDSEPTPTERIVRFYVTEAVLTRPDREGREARFGFRQIAEMLAVRLLLKDGWSLARIADYLNTATLDALLSLLPVTSVQEAAAMPNMTDYREMQAPAPVAAPTEAEKLVQQFAKRYAPRQEAPIVPPTVIAPLEAVRERAQAKQELKTALTRLGVPGETPPRQSQSDYILAPWCRVQIAPDLLEAALRQIQNDSDREQLLEDAVRVFRTILREELNRRSKRST